MEYRNLGSAGVKVSTMCLGAMTLGEADATSMMHKVSADQETSFAILNRALDGGVNFIDTADVYGQDGLSERTLGAWFAKDGRRDEVVLATKFRFTMGTGPNSSGASRYRIRKCVEDSLRRLGTDRIDLYQVHMQDITVSEQETLRALDDLVRQGKVLHIGCSNYAAHRLSDSHWLSKVNGLNSHVTLQAQYSLSVRDIERELVPVCRNKGIGILPWSPLGGGFLTGKYRQGQPPPAGSRLDSKKFKERYDRFDNPRNWKILDVLLRVAGELDAAPAAVALAWLIGKPAVTSVIFGARTVAQVDENLVAAKVSLSAEQRAALDAVSALEMGYPYDMLGRIQGGW